VATTSKTVTVPVELTFTEKFLSDLMVTAFDAHHGGSWFWAEPKDPSSEIPAFEIDGEIWRSVNIIQSEEDPAHDYKVTHDTLIAGIKKLFEPGVLPRRGDLRGQLTKGDDADLDASDADVIVQLGVFGETIYG
jgi:hypothetical protein